MDDWHPFCSMSISYPIPEIRLFQTLTSKDHKVGPVSYSFASFSFHINQTNDSWDTAILKLNLETSKIKIMSDVKGQGHIVYPLSNLCISFSFHINQTKHSWEMAKRVCDLEKTHPKFLKKIGQKRNISKKTSPKCNQVISITRPIMPCFVMIGWVVLTLWYRQPNFC